MKFGLLYLCLLFSLFQAVSCKVIPPTRYLNDINEDVLRDARAPELIIKPGDVLGITVFSDNPAATGIFNQAGGSTPTAEAGSSMAASAAASSPEYIVDVNGAITMHALGRIYVAGLSLAQVDSTLRLRLTPYLSNPYLNVRIKNFRVTVLGEVGRPGVVVSPSQHLNVLEALSMAGDITLTGLKEDVIVVRNKNGAKEYGRLNLTDVGVVRSPYFYLHQNDLVIINPNPRKPGISEQEQLRRLTALSTIVSLITSVALVFSLFR